MSLTIAQRFCGPPASANGGYSCGLLAQALGGTVEVTLRAPPPLDTPLELVVTAAGARLQHGERLIAEARAGQIDDAPPPAPTWAAAQAGSDRYAGHHGHDYPTCFVCGPARAPGDALRLFTGPFAPGQVATLWQPEPALAGAGGRIAEPVLWAAIDCPGYWAAVDGLAPRPTLLLGRMTGQVLGTPAAGERCIVFGWSLGHEGRKYRAGTALLGEDGRCLAQSRQTWIAVAAPV